MLLQPATLQQAGRHALRQRAQYSQPSCAFCAYGSPCSNSSNAGKALSSTLSALQKPAKHKTGRRQAPFAASCARRAARLRCPLSSPSAPPPASSCASARKQSAAPQACLPLSNVCRCVAGMPSDRAHSTRCWTTKRNIHQRHTDFILTAVRRVQQAACTAVRAVHAVSDCASAALLAANIASKHVCIRAAPWPRAQ